MILQYKYVPGRQLKLFEEEPEKVECRFCDIAAGKIQSYQVYSDSDFFAFLDHRPFFRGHVLLIPREHYENIYEMTDEIKAKIFGKVTIISKGIEKALGCDGTFIAINNKVSQSVPHVHVHIIPRRHKDGLKGFFWPREEYGEGEAEKYADMIRTAINDVLKGS